MSSAGNIDFSKYEQAPAAPAPAAQIDFTKYQQPSAAGQQQGFPDEAHAEISARKGGVREWLGDLESDIRQGSNMTAVGRLLHSVGMQPTQNNVSPAAEEMVASPVIGTVHVAQGAADVGGGKILKGGKEVVSGALEAATLPSAFVAPEGAEAASKGASAATSAINRLRPSVMKEGAGELFQTIAKDANKVPVTLDNAQDAALKLMDWQKKTQLGPTLNKFLNRVTNPKMGPMTYEEARDFYQLLGKMSADESMKMAPPVKLQLNRLVAGLKSDIGNAAGTVGHAADYYKALGDYANASRLQNFVSNAQDFLTKAGLKAALGAAGAGGAYTAYQALKK